MSERINRRVFVLAALSCACSSNEAVTGTDTGTDTDTGAGTDTGTGDAPGDDCLGSEPADYDLVPEATQVWQAIPRPAMEDPPEPDVGDVHAEIVPLGDVDGDGLNDLFVARRAVDDEGNDGTILEHGIVFGHAGILEKDAQTHVSEGHGFTIEHGSEVRLDLRGPVTAAGDVNGDGMHDIAVPVIFPEGMGGGDETSGFMVVPGQSAATTVNMDDALASLGFALNAEELADLRAAGDINGDGLADVGAVQKWQFQSPGDGYVVFGPGAGPDLTVEEVVSAGAGIVIRADDTWRLQSIRSAGDWNGDGRGDLAILLVHIFSTRVAAIVASPPAESAELTASEIVADSVVIHTETFGADVDDIVALGDVNDDGLSDLGVRVAEAGWCLTGRAYVVYGRSGGSDVHLGEIAAGVGGAAFDPAPAGILEAIASTGPFGQGSDLVVLERRTPAAEPFSLEHVEYRAYAVPGGASLESGRLDELVASKRAWGVVERDLIPDAGIQFGYPPPWAELVPWQGITGASDHGLAILVRLRGRVHVEEALR